MESFEEYESLKILISTFKFLIGFSFSYKMVDKLLFSKSNLGKKTVKELKALAKSLGLKRYSKLRKKELIELIEEKMKKETLVGGANSRKNIMDEEVPEISVPVLDPIQEKVKKISRKKSKFLLKKRQPQQMGGLVEKRREKYGKKVFHRS